MAMYNDVFISYRRVDKEFARRLDAALKADGREVWVDWEDIPAGSTDFTEDISKGVESSDTFLAILSPDYITSPYCMGELEYAISLHKKIVPVVWRKFEGYDIPASISHINWVYFTPHVGEENDFDSAFQVLKVALDTDHDYVREHTRLTMLAKRWTDKDRARDILLKGIEAQNAQAWLTSSADKIPHPSQDQIDYIFASLDGERRRQRQRQAFIATAVGLVVSAALMVFAFVMFVRAEEARALADEQRTLAEIAQKQAQTLQVAVSAKVARETDPVLGLALALEAEALLDEDLPQIRRVLAQTAFAPGAVDRITEHTSSVMGVSISPDDILIASVDARGNLSLRNPELNTLETYVVDADDLLTDVIFDIRGESLYIIGTSGNLYVWSIEDAAVKSVHMAHEGGAFGIAISEDGAWLATGGYDHIARLWDLSSMEVVREFVGHTGVVLRVAFDDLTNTLVTSSADETMENRTDDTEDRTIRLWDLDTAEQVGVIQTPNFARALAVNNGFISLAMWDVNSGGTVFLIDIQDVYMVDTDDGLNALHAFPVDTIVQSLAFSPNGRLLAAADWSNTLYVWELEHMGQVMKVNSFNERIQALAFDNYSSNLAIGLGNVGNNVYTRSSDNPVDTSVWLWNFLNPGEMGYYEHDELVWRVALSPDDRYAITAYGPLFYDPENPAPTGLAVFDLEEKILSDALNIHDRRVTSVSFHPDGERVISAAQDNTVYLWNFATGEILTDFSRENATANSVYFDYSGERLIAAMSNREILIWDTESGELLQTLTGHTGAVNEAFFGADIDQVVSISTDGTLRLWDVSTGENTLTIEVSRASVLSADIHDNGKLLVTASADRGLYLWDTETGERIHEFIGHTGNVLTVRLSADGNTLISASEDRTIRFWDMSNGQEVMTILGHDNWVRDMMLTSDGQRLVSVSDDRSMRVWKLFNNTDELAEWIPSVRYIGDISCAQRIAYAVPGGDCERVDLNTYLTPPVDD